MDKGVIVQRASLVINHGALEMDLRILDWILWILLIFDSLPLPIFDKRSTRLVLGGLGIGLFWFFWDSWDFLPISQYIFFVF